MKSRRKLRNLRKLLGLSGGQLAIAAGITRQAYSQLENGTMTARPERMVPINKLLRDERAAQIKSLEYRIELLRNFDIDESLYLRDEVETLEALK
jgi:transcriptional regulator with XRE-family HTH domain